MIPSRKARQFFRLSFTLTCVIFRGLRWLNNVTERHKIVSVWDEMASSPPEVMIEQSEVSKTNFRMEKIRTRDKFSYDVSSVNPKARGNRH